jgi:hypothetical protein
LFLDRVAKDIFFQKEYLLISRIIVSLDTSKLTAGLTFDGRINISKGY